MWVVVRGIVVWVFGDDLVKIALYVVVGFLVLAYVEASAATAAIFAQPFGQWWLAGVGGGAGAVSAPVSGGSGETAVLVPRSITALVLSAGVVSDAERYQLARGAGWSAADAIVATAISIAEDGSGDPSALSGANFNGTRDFGLWQINSIHWAKCGGQAALAVPAVNAACAFGIFGPGRNWCAWSTYERSCGLGHTGSYLAFLGRARAAAGG